MRSATSTKRSVLLAVRWAGTMSAVAALAESSRTVVARCMFLACECGVCCRVIASDVLELVDDCHIDVSGFACSSNGRKDDFSGLYHA